MIICRHFKGITSLAEMDNLPWYEIQTLYYTLFKEKEEQSKLTKEQQQARALASAIEDQA